MPAPVPYHVHTHALPAPSTHQCADPLPSHPPLGAHAYLNRECAAILDPPPFVFASVIILLSSNSKLIVVKKGIHLTLTNPNKPNTRIKSFYIPARAQQIIFTSPSRRGILRVSGIQQPSPAAVGQRPLTRRITVITSLASEARRAPALAALRQRCTAIPIPTPTAATPPAAATPPSVSLCPPPFAPVSLSGSQARGLAYERKVGKILASHCAKAGWKLWDHQWFAYKDDSGVKHFQPDFIIERETDNVLIEVKLTFVDTSAQVNKYLHYLKIFGLNCFPLIIVRHLTPTASLIITDFDKIAPNAVLHLWI